MNVYLGKAAQKTQHLLLIVHNAQQNSYEFRVFWATHALHPLSIPAKLSRRLEVLDQPHEVAEIWDNMQAILLWH